MFLFEPIQKLESLSATLPVPESGVAAFSPFAFSPDGKYIAGRYEENAKSIIGVFSRETKTVTSIKAPDGGDILPSDWNSLDWIDGARFIVWDETRATAYIHDVAAVETREVPGIQGPCDIRVVEEGKAIIVNRTRAESDIWMLTLGTIDNRPSTPETGSAP